MYEMSGCPYAQMITLLSIAVVAVVSDIPINNIPYSGYSTSIIQIMITLILYFCKYFVFMLNVNKL